MTLDLNVEELQFLRRQTWHALRNLKAVDRSREAQGRTLQYTNRITFLTNLATKLENPSCSTQSPSSAG